MAIVIKFSLVLSLVVLVLLPPPCRPLEVSNYQGTEDWPELTVARLDKRIIEEDRTGFNMTRLGRATIEPEQEFLPEPEPKPLPLPEPEPEPEPLPLPEPEPEPLPLPEPKPEPEPEPLPPPEPEPEPEPVPGMKPNPAIIMPIPTPENTAGNTTPSAIRSHPLLSSVVCSSLFLGWLSRILD